MLIDLGDNTNRWGMPPAAERVLRAESSANEYPEPFAESLKAELARTYGGDVDCVVTGCGSDDVLDSAIRAFGAPGMRLAMQAPSFSLIPSLAALNHMECSAVPLLPSFDPDADALTAAAAAVTYLCSPNNPTGTVASRDAIVDVVERVRGLVIIDEAYAEFADGSFVDLALSRPNVLVVRTFSKAWGLAGLRVGYGVGSPDVAARVEKARGLFKVSTLAAAAALAALQNDVEWMRTHVALARASCLRLERALVRRDIAPLPSCANFVLVPVADAAAMAREMRAQGVRVRSFTGLPALTSALARSGGEAIRITAGPTREMDAAVDAFDAAIASLDARRSMCA